MEIPSVEEVRGAVKGHYRVERLFGHGGMGAVFLGHHSSLGSTVAIKVIRIPAEEGSDELARFKREATLAANLPHPNIVPVYEFDLAGDLAYFVMPFVEGESLAEYLEKHGHLTFAKARELLQQIGAALTFAHSRGVIHRDIKPANILREEATGRWLITDFGIARGTRAGDTGITKTGMVIGTPAYMAPEQAAGVTDVDGRADLYSLAAVVCEALTGSRTDTLRDAIELERALRAARPDLTSGVARALTVPLALDRDRRPPSVEEWLDAVQRTQRGRGMQLALIGSTVVAVVLAGIIGGWRLMGRSSGEDRTPTIAIVPFSVTGDLDGVDLRTGLAKAFEEQLRWIPEYRVVTTGLLERAIADRFGAATPSWDSIGHLAEQNFGASEILVGNVVVTNATHARISIQVRESTSQRVVGSADTAGSVDSLSALVSALVTVTFAERVAREQAGWSAALPRGLDAFRNYIEGDRYFRRAAYDEAIEQYEIVIQRDSSFAPAYFKRMLCEVLKVQPTRATTAARSALDAARRYREGLDPTTRELLRGYDILVSDGDLEQAHEVFQRIVDDHPNAVDAWFVLGYLQFTFGPLLGMSPVAAQYALGQAYELDPDFAAVVAQLAFVAVLQENQPLAQRYLAQYLLIDSTSVWAELVRMVDSLLYGSPKAALAVERSFDMRPPAVLEIIALTGGQLAIRRPERLIAQNAIAALWERAVTRQDRAVAFRMRMANLLGTGRLASTDTLRRDARRRNVPQDELDRWTVLAAVTGIAELGDERTQASAARRLLGQTDADATALWLVARWYRGRDPRSASQAERLLRARADSTGAGPLERSLRDDLDALDLLMAGDTVAALHTWAQAAERFTIERILFGLVGSLWPLRLERVRVAAALGDHEEVLVASADFESMAGFIDQVAWLEVLPLRAEAFRATGDGLSARNIYQTLSTILEDASGSRAALRDSVRSWLSSPRSTLQ